MEELIKCGADTFIRVGTAGRVCDAAFDETLDGVINTAAVRDEGTTIHYIPIEYPAVADRHVVDALAVAAKNLGYHYAEGITQSKDSFYGQHEPENMPAESRLKERWEAWRRGNVMTSEMEAAALFVISSIRGCRAASIMSFVDMKKTIEVARDALKILIKQDAAKQQGTEKKGGASQCPFEIIKRQTASNTIFRWRKGKWAGMYSFRATPSAQT